MRTQFEAAGRHSEGEHMSTNWKTRALANRSCLSQITKKDRGEVLSASNYPVIRN